MTLPTHPYFPLDLHLPSYVPMQVGFDYILGVFFTAVALVFGVTWSLAVRHPKLTNVERLLACWFMITGLIHFVIEGWVVVKADFFKDASGNYLSDTWKEYSKADSRYASRDSFIISMEAVTAFMWGPLSVLLVHGIFAAKPWRYSLMVVVSVGQVYGDVLYYGTCYLEGFIHSRPEPLYFWFYFVFINAIWIVVPSLCILHAWGRINAAVRSSASKTKRK